MERDAVQRARELFPSRAIRKTRSTAARSRWQPTSRRPWPGLRLVGAGEKVAKGLFVEVKELGERFLLHDGQSFFARGAASHTRLCHAITYASCQGSRSGSATPTIRTSRDQAPLRRGEPLHGRRAALRALGSCKNFCNIPFPRASSLAGDSVRFRSRPFLGRLPGPRPARSFTGGGGIRLTQPLSLKRQAPPQLRWTAVPKPRASPRKRGSWTLSPSSACPLG